jgi:hypothetical protein
MIGEATIGISFIFFNYPLGFMLWWLSYSAGFALVIVWLLKADTVKWLNELGFNLPRASF